jgi:CPA2 family monovalent cation:H+ antiporter-2
MHDLSFATGIMCLVILLLIFLLKKLHQPYLIAYILAGIILGPHVTGVFRDPESINTIGEFGILLLMFFLGMEVQIPDRKSLLLQPLIAQGTKILVSFIFSAVLCRIMNWPTPTLVLLTAFLTFNSTAVASELMRRNGELTTFFGSIVLNMLLLQDILLAPVITFFQLTGTNEWNATRFIAAILGSASIFFLLRAIRNRNLFQLPFFRLFEKDHELQVFAGACICLGFAMLAELIGLSGPVGRCIHRKNESLRLAGRSIAPFQDIFHGIIFYVNRHYARYPKPGRQLYHDLICHYPDHAPPCCVHHCCIPVIETALEEKFVCRRPAFANR